MSKKTYGLFLTESTLLLFFIYLFRGRRVCILGTYSYIQNHGGYLQKIVNSLYARGIVEITSDKIDLFPYKDVGDFQRLTNVFSECERWMENEFKIGTISGSYSLAVKHIISNRTHALYERNYNIHYLGDNIEIPVLNKSDRSFHLHRFTTSMKKVHRFEGVKYLINLLLFLASTTLCLFWIVSRIRLFSKRHNILLATDYNGGPRDMKFWDHLSPNRENTLVVVRDNSTLKTFGHLLKDYRVIFDNEGDYSILNAMMALLISTRDSFLLFVQYLHFPSDYYRQICFLPFKRIKYRALFNKYKCAYFWGRDDYNYQHIIRSQEIRRAGGVSMGCNHGIQSIVTSAFQLRYLDFDYYYMHGLDQYINVYSKYWPEHMIARGVGSMFSDPEQQAVIKETEGTDVAIIIAPSFHQDLIYDAISQLATSFPDLKFWIVTKPKHRFDREFGTKYQNLILSGLHNVQESIEDVYDLLPRCKYVFSESSTLLAEAVYFDRIALCFDPDPSFKFLYYRKFPEMIFKDVEGLIERIRETRYLPVHYNDPNLGKMTFKGDRHPWDLIKEDMILNVPDLNYERQD